MFRWILAVSCLFDESCVCVEIHFARRNGGQCLKTAFILCDDYTDLAAKLFLLTDQRHWSDQKPGARFKNYNLVQRELDAVFGAKSAANLPTLTQIPCPIAKPVNQSVVWLSDL